MEDYNYITFMGKCNKSKEEFDIIMTKCIELAEKYKFQFNGLLRDITEKTHIAFSGLFIVKCDFKDCRDIYDKTKSELDKIAFIHSMNGGTIQ